MARAIARKFLARLLGRYGYVLREAALPPRGFSAFLEVYRRRAGLPRAVFDIGVGRGTPWLYEAFPDAAFTLVEPLTEFAGDIRDIQNRYDASWHACALGERDGESEILVPETVKTGASLLAREANWAGAAAERGDSVVNPRQVPIRTLDSLAAETALPQVIKLDVEGAELAVLRGGAATLRTTDLVLVEASFMPRYEGGSDLTDLAFHLKQHGFRLAEIVDISTIGSDRLISYVDAAFIRADSRFWQGLS